jgi:hypothetical protein
MGVKLREELWGYELAISACFLMISLTGMIICIIGIQEIPTCTYGAMECYFFVQVCGESYFNHNNNPYTCAWVNKQRSIEGSSATGSEHFNLAIVAAVLAILPGIALMISTIIRNERTLLAMLEAGKSFLVFDSVIIVVGCLIVHELTFDCRYYDQYQHGNDEKCQGGYIKYVAGACIILLDHMLLLMGIISFGEMERRRVREDVTDVFALGDIGDLRTDAVPMSIRVTTNQPGEQALA